MVATINGPLSGVRVVEFANGIHGPYAPMLLADMGADVIKVEPPTGDLNRSVAVVKTPQGFEMGSQFYACNRNKRAVCLNLQTDEGRSAALDLLVTADVLVENMRPGVMARFGLDYDNVRQINPPLVYASATAYGPEGPRAHLPALDIVAQAAGGLVSHTGTVATGPLPVGAMIADHGSAVWMAFAVALALFQRERTGEGQHVQSSLLGSQLALQAFELTHFLFSGKEPRLGGPGHPLAKGAWRVFRADDGWFALAGITDERWPAFCEAIERPELIDEPRFQTSDGRLEYGDELVEILEQEFSRQKLTPLVARLEACDQIVAPVADYTHLEQDPQVRANGYIASFDDEVFGSLPLVATPLRLRGAPRAVWRRPPFLDEHTGEVLSDLGYSHERIAQLYASGAVGAATA